MKTKIDRRSFIITASFAALRSNIVADDLTVALDGDLIGWAAKSKALGRGDEEADDEFAKKELGESGVIIDGKAFPDFSPLDVETKARKWRACESILKLLEQINAKAPDRNKKADGTIGDAAHASRSSDHNPWIIDGLIGVVSAIDITHDPKNGCDCDQITEALRANRDPRFKYIIWNKQICNSQAIGGVAAWTWRPYGGRNKHTTHFHLSVKSSKAQYDSKEAWNLKPWA